jgi:hypothetical protein
MRRTLISSAIASAIVLTAPAVARADDPTPPATGAIAIKAVVGGTKGPKTAKQVVIQDVDAYTAFFEGGAPVDMDGGFDPATETCVGIALGFRGVTGYSVAITSVVRTAPGRVTVKYRENEPDPGVLPTTTFDYPFCIAKIAKLSDAVSFEREQEHTWSELDLSMSSTRPTRPNTRFALKRDGTAHLEQTSPIRVYVPVDFAASKEELDAVSAAYAQANGAKLPRTIDARHLIVATGATVVKLGVQADGKSTSTTALLDHYKDSTGDYTARVKPLVDALAAIQDRWVMQSFDETVSGKVVRAGSDVGVALSSGPRLRVANEPFRSMLKKAAGKKVIAYGKAKLAPASTWKGDIEVEWVIGIVTEDVAFEAETPAPGAPDSVAKGTVVTVYGQEGGRCLVVLPSGSRGWVDAGAVALGLPPASPPSPPSPPSPKSPGIGPSIGG